MSLKNRNRPKVNEEQLQLEKLSLSGCGKTSLLSQKRELHTEEEVGFLFREGKLNWVLDLVSTKRFLID